MGQVDQGKEDHVPSPHPPEFRRRAGELARTGDESISALAKSLGTNQVEHWFGYLTDQSLRRSL